MAKERGQADEEAGISMRAWNWDARKKRDALRCPHCGQVVLPGGVPGTFDFPKVRVPVWREHRLAEIDVEVKAGTTSLPFAAVSEEQRTWATENTDCPKWLWLNLGTRIKGKRYPRYTILFPFELFLEIEKNSEAKSIPYGLATLEPYRLTWEGNRTWSVPESHPIRTVYHYL